MAARNTKAGPSRRSAGQLAMAEAHPLTLPALASDLPRRLLAKRIYPDSQSASARHRDKGPEQIDPEVMNDLPASPRTKRRQARLLGEETKLRKKQVELEREREHLAGAELSRDPNAPSDNLLRSLHLHAADFYSSQGLMPPDPKLKREHASQPQERQNGSSTRARRVDMTSAIEGRGLVVLGMIVQEIINDALERNGMRERHASSVALEQERQLGLEPRVLDESETDEGEAGQADNADIDASDDGTT